MSPSPTDSEWSAHKLKELIAGWRRRQSCERIEAEHLEPGWVCCRCSVYNGEWRTNCKQCNHKRCGI